MKKVFSFVFIFLFAASALTFAKESPYYAKTVFIAKIVSHQKGYKVIYSTNKNDYVTVYIPIAWFSKADGFVTDDGFTKAELYYRPGPTYPVMTIYWKEGKFHHVRLFVNSDFNDRSWGVLQANENIDAKFDPNKDPDFVFQK